MPESQIPRFDPDRYADGLRLDEDWVVSVSEDGATFLFHGPASFSVRNAWPWLRGFLTRLVQGTTIDELSALGRKTECLHLLGLLETRRVLKPCTRPSTRDSGAQEKQLLWLSQTSPLPADAVQERLERAHALIIGCGGTGAQVVQHLVGYGVSRFTLVDGDVVQLSNLNRQFTYSREQLGRKKVEALRSYVLSRAPESTIECHDLFIRSSADFDPVFAGRSLPSVVVNCADRPFFDVQIAVTEFAIRHEVPALFGAVGLASGQLGPFLVSDRARRSYLEELRRRRDMDILNAEPCRGSIGHTNTIVGTLMAADVLRVIGGLGACRSEDRVLSFDFETLEFRSVWEAPDSGLPGREVV